MPLEVITQLIQNTDYKKRRANSSSHGKIPLERLLEEPIAPTKALQAAVVDLVVCQNLKVRPYCMRYYTLLNRSWSNWAGIDKKV